MDVSLSSVEVLPRQIGLAKVLQRQAIDGVLKVVYRTPFKAIITFLGKANALKLVNMVQNIWL